MKDIKTIADGLHTKLVELFHYDQQTGNLMWKNRPETDFSTMRVCRIWNSKFAGSIAGYVRPDGYRKICIDRVMYQAHRLVWIMHYGNIGDFQIDHINQTPSDNRIENLRVVTPSENQRNKSMSRKNVSGFVGVSWHRGNGKWQAKIRVGGTTKYLGLFSNKDDAIASRVAANVTYGFHQNHGLHKVGSINSLVQS